MRKILATLFLSTFSFIAIAQSPTKYTSSEIYKKIQKLNFLGSVMYIAAHPDDENTALISYFSNEVNARTRYLSLTRGDGGQNLIGKELRELLGVLRTQELLAARRVDGGEQFFTRANDFGFSKTPDETLTFWNEKEVLGDVVWAIRNFKPDIIINRFDHRTPGTTHGHHTTSAILSVEAFDKTGDKNVYPEQLESVDTWQPKRLFFNTSWWFYGSQEKFKKADKSNLIAVDAGVYYPELGLSNGEIAGLSRSQHKCQGFGTAGTRGEKEEYLELLKGTMPKDQNNLFEGINTTWTRVKGGKAIEVILKDVEDHFDFAHPEKHLDALLDAYVLISKLKDAYWRDYKLAEIKDIILACSGLYLNVTSNTPYATPEEDITYQLELVNRTNQHIKLESIAVNGKVTKSKYSSMVPVNISEKYPISVKLNKDILFNTPYWLTEEGTLGMYNVTNPQLIGLPETPSPINTTVNLKINNVSISFTKPLFYKKVYPDKGETYQPFYILPKASSSIDKDVILFADTHEKEITVSVKAFKANINGNVSLHVPERWKVSPAKIPFSIALKDDFKNVSFKVTPPDGESVGIIAPIINLEGRTYDKTLKTITYDHIPNQYVLLPAKTKVVRLNIQKEGNYIGYIAGAGDKVPESLQEIGYHVSMINPDTMSLDGLKQFDAVIIGIRAYNVLETLPYKQSVLETYVNTGGTVITQYNTNRGLLTNHLAPFDITLSRDRVTNENSEVIILEPKHTLLNFPNKITDTDFEGWTQERGLYFPSSWGKEFTSILSMHDKGETAKKGSLLVAKYGKGYYIYTGLSFFRELPAGVPGAFKLFTNLISIGKSNLNTKNIKG
ncbi:GlcNAc-PI de-N-acetylase [Neptunitalea chrysea]|uniref:GlcNAc-PI de-N-acetylase n=1 Tax=Neptunitalea chrysea TaxID=1647581 RepID=A0A9W6EU85_9FLAO|nr:PIG-L family deacetylase [Neptunitalea chrysea]GLB51381.1 GlcNAc-PI de-N-acetylase [Neptunitalea chrysea]